MSRRAQRIEIDEWAAICFSENDNEFKQNQLKSLPPSYFIYAIEYISLGILE